MKLSDFRDLDYQNAGNWPQGVKLTFCALLFLLICLLGWYFQIRGQQDDLESKQNQERTLKQDFSVKQAKAVNLEALRQQLEEMKDMLRQMLLQLPSKTEMPELLVDISQTALSSGIENDLFQPGAEQIKEFYAEKPITLRMVGSYHQFGAFISGVASLPRVVILTMHDVSLRPQQNAGGAAGAKPALMSGPLALEGTVKTYRYVDDDEQAANAPPVPGKPGVPPPKPAAGGHGGMQ
ncbi:MAG: fimbrial protein [Lysobacterales bacterium 69-70]|nr:type 4a pilus biogenesis protein PilO [Xanthomonadaceae bacterium]ODU35266.1 MAG: fimbrial protein [Xanthomonadaceae bacterium SCN 69-320]ODV17268.1 MAG: fimbrial protein [Xanthomonadaceae bacterium SCN 69-25]OJY94165.1 MAG: fimbrial protein [Xanthomonadales bacterium 69-70]